MKLREFLEYKPLYYAKIDYERMPKVYARVKNYFRSIHTIHLVGTNGKGTTGRFLASALHNLGYTVGHYTSPHIMKFNERIWLNGADIEDSYLENFHQELQSILKQEELDSLSYFEYTTFLAMLAFNGCEYIVLEAGLGGEHDATAVFPKTLTLVTPISYDHEAFLGTSIQSISREKLGAIEKYAILASQEHASVYDIAKEIQKRKSLTLTYLNDVLQEIDKENIDYISKSLQLVPYLKNNLALSIAALNFLNIEYTKESFNNALLFGRLSKLGENILVDVGHNPLAAHSVLESLQGNKYILVYNTYEDKEYKEILSILKPIIKHVEIIAIKEVRIEKTQMLQKVLTDLKIKYAQHKKVQETKKYLVFGSFKVVEQFLKGYNG